MINTLNTEQIKAALKELNHNTPEIECFWHNGYTYTKEPIYQGWYCTGYKWIATGDTKEMNNPDSWVDYE